MKKFWSNTEIETLKKMYCDTDTSSIANLLVRNINAVYGMANKLKLKKTDQYLATLNSNRILTENQRNCCFKKGSTPPNKGKKHAEYMTPEQIEKTKKSRYKKGNVPFNVKYDGHERISVDGYVEIIKESEKKHGIVYQIKETPMDNPNYWFSNYQEKGEIYNLPNQSFAHVPGWNKAIEVCKKNKITLYNLSNNNYTNMSKIRLCDFYKIIEQKIEAL
jgi:hypothetical protein